MDDLATFELGGSTVVLRRAEAGDIRSIVDLLAADQLGATRDGVNTAQDLAAYQVAFRAIDADPAHVLVVAHAGQQLVGTLQLSFIPGLARRGARAVGLDNSAAQLATARQLQDRFGLRYPLIHASAEQAPLADARFDLAISEYGASIWCDPYAWIPEAARLLRPGGQLIFLVNSALLMLAVPDEDDQPATERLLRPYFGMHRFEWPGDESVEFHLGHGEMIRLLRGCGLEVEDLLELRPDPDAITRYPFVTLEWARQWPCEEVWKARKR